jgi:hypothetical protein
VEAIKVEEFQKPQDNGSTTSKVAEPICERISICGRWRFVGGDR